MIFDFIQKSISVIESQRTYEIKERNPIKDISFNLISDKRPRISLNEKSALNWVALEISFNF